MSIPVVSGAGDLVRIVWVEEQVRAELDRWDESQHSISAELVVWSDRQPSPGLLHRARLNLMSSQSRRTLRNVLQERIPELDWHAILEQLCVYSVERYRDGDPAIDLRTVDPYRRQRWLISPYLEMSGPTLFYADGDTGKSMLALWIAIQVALGSKDMQKSIPVLYCDWETDVETHAERMIALCRGLGIDRDAMPPVFYKHMTTTLSSARTTICKEVDRVKAGMVVIDSLGVAGDGNPEESGTAIRIFQSLRMMPVPPLCIHHKRKPSGIVTTGISSKAEAFGSVYFTNLARLVWDLTAVKTEDRATLNISLVNVKANNGRLQRRHAYRLEFTNTPDNHLECCTVKSIDPDSVPEFVEKLTLTDRVMLELKQGPRTSGELAEATDKSDGSVRVICSRLQKSGAILKLGSGEWAMKAQDGA